MPLTNTQLYQIRADGGQAPRQFWRDRFGCSGAEINSVYFQMEYDSVQETAVEAVASVKERHYKEEGGPETEQETAQPHVKERCLGCGGEFISWDHVRNRLCEPCRDRSDNPLAPDSYGDIE
jgi:hypothetical protein